MAKISKTAGQAGQAKTTATATAPAAAAATTDPHAYTTLADGWQLFLETVLVGGDIVTEDTEQLEIEIYRSIFFAGALSAFHLVTEIFKRDRELVQAAATAGRPLTLDEIKAVANKALADLRAISHELDTEEARYALLMIALAEGAGDGGGGGKAH